MLALDVEKCRLFQIGDHMPGHAGDAADCFLGTSAF